MDRQTRGIHNPTPGAKVTGTSQLMKQKQAF